MLEQWKDDIVDKVWSQDELDTFSVKILTINMFVYRVNFGKQPKYMKRNYKMMLRDMIQKNNLFITFIVIKQIGLNKRHNSQQNLMK